MILTPIGIIRSPYNSMNDAPSQGRKTEDLSTIEVFPEYSDGLKDIEMATHLIVLYWAHHAHRNSLQTRTPFSSVIHGVFATRSPHRPNPINVGIVDLMQKEKNILTVKGLDAIDGSPLIDLKPYSADIDSIPDATIGWQGSD